MYPTLVRIGSFEISSFGLMMFLSFIAASGVLSRRFRAVGLPEDIAGSLTIAAAAGGMIGAKVYYAILYRDFGSLFERAGLVWYGGFIGGVLACSYVVLSRRVDYLTVADAAAPALAIGYAIGRIGCFLVGDDYGRPTTSAIGVAFPRGAPPTTADALRSYGVTIDPHLPADTLLHVHPTQLYESAAAFVMFVLLIRVSRRRVSRGAIFGLFLLLLGIERFLVEFVRAKDDRLLGPLTIAQAISVLLAIAGTALIFRRRTAYAGAELS